jgi:hypothetical protein
VCNDFGNNVPYSAYLEAFSQIRAPMVFPWRHLIWSHATKLEPGFIAVMGIDAISTPCSRRRNTGAVSVRQMSVEDDHLPIVNGRDVWSWLVVSRVNAFPCPVWHRPPEASKAEPVSRSFPLFSAMA